MHTMHEHPTLCLGCLVVVATSEESSKASPKTAALASASSPDGSCSFLAVWLTPILLFLYSKNKHTQRHLSVMTLEISMRVQSYTFSSFENILKLF